MGVTELAGGEGPAGLPPGDRPDAGRHPARGADPAHRRRPGGAADRAVDRPRAGLGRAAGGVPAGRGRDRRTGARAGWPGRRRAGRQRPGRGALRRRRAAGTSRHGGRGRGRGLPGARHVTERYVLAVDQGTTSTRSIVFDRAGRLVAVRQREHRQHFPRPGWVEHDPEEIWANTQLTAAQALRDVAGSPGQVVALGIANQRETTVVWERATGRPLVRALVWQDTRTGPLVEQLAARPEAPLVRERTGLELAGYFAGPGRAGAGRTRRAAVRDHGELADLEPHRRAGRRGARHRRDQRQPDPADGC